MSRGAFNEREFRARIAAGTLDSKITIRRATTTLDDYGAPTSTWAPLGTVRARIDNIETIQMVEQAGEVQSIREVITFTARYLAGVTVQDHLQFDGDDFEILSIKPLGRRRGLEIKARKRGL